MNLLLQLCFMDDKLSYNIDLGNTNKRSYTTSIYKSSSYPSNNLEAQTGNTETKSATMLPSTHQQQWNLVRAHRHWQYESNLMHESGQYGYYTYNIDLYKYSSIMLQGC